MEIGGRNLGKPSKETTNKQTGIEGIRRNNNNIINSENSLFL
jgi:hypothetical protein